MAAGDTSHSKTVAVMQPRAAASTRRTTMAPGLRLQATAVLASLLCLASHCTAQLDQGKPGLLELTAASFVASFKALPDDRWVLVEFYAHW